MDPTPLLHAPHGPRFGDGVRQEPSIERRTFMALVTGGLLAAPLAAEGQQAKKVWRIGSINPQMSTTPQGQGTFYDRMRELGWVHGQNFVVERRAYGDQIEPIPDPAAELIRLGVDIFIVSGSIVSSTCSR